jgi:hypothetical protein
MKTLNWRIILTGSFLALLGFAFGSVLGRMLKYQKTGYDLDAWLIVLFPALMLTGILWHELGHAFGGWLAGFQLRLLAAGPLRVAVSLQLQPQPIVVGRRNLHGPSPRERPQPRSHAPQAHAGRRRWPLSFPGRRLTCHPRLALLGDFPQLGCHLRAVGLYTFIAGLIYADANDVPGLS